MTLSAYESEYKILLTHKDTLEDVLKQIDNRIELKVVELVKSKEFNLVEFLQKEFGKKLEIIEGDK